MNFFLLANNVYASATTNACLTTETFNTLYTYHTSRLKPRRYGEIYFESVHFGSHGLHDTLTWHAMESFNGVARYYPF